MIIANYDLILYKDMPSLVVWARCARVAAARLGCCLASAPGLPVPNQADTEGMTTPKGVSPEL